MRYEKELVGLNYQLEVLEKDLASGGKGNAEVQRNYQKTRRECEQK